MHMRVLNAKAGRGLKSKCGGSIFKKTRALIFFKNAVFKNKTAWDLKQNAGLAKKTSGRFKLKMGLLGLGAINKVTRTHAYAPVPTRTRTIL